MSQGAPGWPAPRTAAEPHVTSIDSAAAVRRLREEFPHLGFVVDAAAGRWAAVVPDGVIRARNGMELREQIMTVMRAREPRG